MSRSPGRNPATRSVGPPLLIVGPFLSAATGTRSVCEDLAAQLSAAGWAVITTSDRPGRLARLTDMVGTVWRRRQDYRVAHVEAYAGQGFLWAEVVCAALTRLGKPFVLTVHSGSFPTFAARWPRRVRRLLRSARSVTSPSPFLREALRAQRSDIVVIPNAIDVRAYEFRLREKPRPRLVWLRAFHRAYNPQLAPRALAITARDFPDVSLTMIGPDKRDGSLQRTMRIAEQLGVRERIRFTGAIAKTEVPASLDRGDVFLNTTNVDNTPVSVIEAMASGLCVVSTNVGGIPHLLEHERDAVLVPPDDPGAVATAVRRLLEEPALAAALSRNARAKAERFDRARVAPQWERILDDAARLTDD